MEANGTQHELDIQSIQYGLDLLSMEDNQKTQPAQLAQQTCIPTETPVEARIKELEQQIQELSRKCAELLEENKKLRDAGRNLIQSLMELECSQ